MRIVFAAALIALSITFGGAVSAGKKAPTNKETIIGTWKLTETTALVGSEFVFTFTNDGKFTVGNENYFELAKGRYAIDGDTLKMTPTLVWNEPKQKWESFSIRTSENEPTRDARGRSTSSLPKSQ